MQLGERLNLITRGYTRQRLSLALPRGRDISFEPAFASSSVHCTYAPTDVIVHTVNHVYGANSHCARADWYSSCNTNTISADIRASYIWLQPFLYVHIFNSSTNIARRVNKGVFNWWKRAYRTRHWLQAHTQLTCSEFLLFHTEQTDLNT